MTAFYLKHTPCTVKKPFSLLYFPQKNHNNLVDRLNVISVDWRRLCNPAPFFFTAARNAKIVGRHLAGFIRGTLVKGLRASRRKSYSEIGEKLILFQKL